MSSTKWIKACTKVAD